MEHELEEIKGTVIEFYTAETQVDVLPPPVPSVKMMPAWWYNASRHVGNEWEEGSPAPSPTTFKQCQPFTDVLRTGDMIPLWQDFSYGNVSPNSDIPQIEIDWGQGRYPFPSDAARGMELDTPIAHKDWYSWAEIEGVKEGIIPNASFSFTNPWIIRTPPGYSCLFTAPINGEDPRIRLFSGIVHTDTYFNAVNFFFGMRKEAPPHGILKKGMPLVQVIPFKREEWTSVVKPIKLGSPEFNHRINVITEISSVITGAYKSQHGCPVVFK